MILVTCEIKECLICDVPYGFPDSMKSEANEQKKLHSKNHPEKPQAVKIKYNDMLP